MPEESPDVRLARIEEKLDNALRVIPDHESRLRGLELTKEECQQKERLKVLETEVEALKATHNQDAGAEKANHSMLEYVLAGAAIAEGLIIVLQFTRGLS